jgi:hypothetical protein
MVAVGGMVGVAATVVGEAWRVGVIGLVTSEVLVAGWVGGKVAVGLAAPQAAKLKLNKINKPKIKPSFIKVLLLLGCSFSEIVD